MAMLRKVKTAWVKALVSGRYKQGQDYLRVDPGPGKRKSYCCLGVLAHTQGAKFSSCGFKLGEVENNSSSKLDRGVCSFGLTGKQKEHLIAMNDGEGMDHHNSKSFKEIAAWIKKNIKVSKKKK